MVYPADEDERFLKGHNGKLFITISIIFLLLKLTQRLLPPLLPELIDDLGITVFLAGAALTTLRLTTAVAQYPSGRAADQFNRSTLILASLLTGVIALGVLALSKIYIIFLFGLVLFGLCLALFFPAARALLSDIYHEKRGRAFGVHAMGIDFAGILAAGIAILIVTVATWRAAFIPILVVILPFGLLFYALSRENVRVCAIDLDIHDTGRRIFTEPSVRRVLVVYCLFSIAQSGITSFLPTFLINVHGFPFEIASSSFALIYGVGIFSKPIAGALSDRIPRQIVGGGNQFLAGLGVMLMILTSNSLMVLLGVAVFAFGQRGVAPPLQAYLMDTFAEDSMAGDLGAFRGLYMAAGSLGPVYTGFLSGVFGFIPAYATLLILYLVGSAILLWSTIKPTWL